MKSIKAGCILINIEEKTIALVCRKGEFSFPKGHLEEGETIIECAIRETIEETGHKCHLLCDKEIAKIEYVSSRGENVENYFFIAIDDGVSIEYINEKDKEKTVWINYLAVEDKLIYPNLIEFWKSIKSFVKRVIEGE